MAYSIIQIVDAERTGVANYDPNPDTSEPEPVLKASSPAKFHDAIYLFECRIVFEGALGMVCFWFYRRLSD